MRFSIASAALLFTAISSTSALPTSADGADTNVLLKRAGPSGSVVEPVGGQQWHVGDKLHFLYKRTISPETYTNKLNLILRSFDGKVTYNANVITMASNLTYPASAEASNIEAWFTIPPLAAGYDNPDQTSWSCNLEVYEEQGGSVGSTIPVFKAAAPRLYISNA